MQQWKTLKKETILDHSKFLRVEQHTIELPNGKTIDRWPWIISPDYALILPVTKEKAVLLLHQVKYAVRGTTFAPVGGYLDAAEDPLIAAKRELREEMGYATEQWVSLGSYPNNGNHGGGKGHLFIALDVQKVGEPIIDDLEEMEIHKFSADEVEQLLFRGEVKVMGWVALIAMGLLYLRKV